MHNRKAAFGGLEEKADMRQEDRMHPNVTRAFNEIDAAVFSGDTFFDAANLEELKRMLARWQAKLPDLEAMAATREDDDE